MNRTREVVRAILDRGNVPWRGLATLAGASVPALVLAANIVGTSGPDVLEGTTEDDKINGKGGDDVMMGLPGDDTYIVGQPGDQVLEAVGDGTDTVVTTVNYTLPIHVEILTLGGNADIDGTGNDLDNRLNGNPGDNKLDGMTGDDRMTGREGNDTYVVDSAGDEAIEAANEGTDRVRASVTYTLGAHVENLVLTGESAINGTGNELRNLVRGNSANNTLNGKAGDDRLVGGAGNDRLIGGPGNDKLTGGPGNDSFQYDETPDEATNQDRILDFEPANDVIRLIGAAFPALTTAGTLQAAAFKSGASANSDTQRILYDPGTGVLRYDADGSGPIVAVRFGRLLNPPVLTRENFVVVNPAVTAVNYTAEIQPIFSGRCIGCHNVATAPQGLVLDADNSYAHLVNVASKEVPSLLRVKPGDPDNSYLVQKIEGTAAVGGRMPLGRPPLDPEVIVLIRRWISEGANP